MAFPYLPSTLKPTYISPLDELGGSGSEEGGTGSGGGGGLKASSAGGLRCPCPF